MTIVVALYIGAKLAAVSKNLMTSLLKRKLHMLPWRGPNVIP